MDIDRFFSLGPAAPFEVHEVFTDREAALAAFRNRSVAHASRNWDTAELMDFQRPAENLLTFIGLGGVGKSTLLRHAAELATAGHLAGVRSRGATAHVNFAEPDVLSFETVLLRVRAAVGSLGRSWPAFDLALALYWERKHPGENLVTFLRRRTPAGAASARVADQMTSTVDQMVGGFGLAGLGYQLLKLAGQKAAHNNRVKRLAREFPPFEALISETDPGRMLGYLPVLLARDLETHRRKEPALVLCLLDTFEHVQVLTPEREGLEDLVSRMVYLMPNVLFLASSRRHLTWHDPIRATTLAYGGQQRWPGLRTPDQDGIYGPSGDQLALDGFDDPHADEYLRYRLTHEGRPAIPRHLRRRIIDGAVGSPHYLELSVSLYEQIAARGQAPEEELFGLPFPELVVRLIRDLDVVDRDLLRAAALLQAFDADTLAAVLPRLRRRRIEDFLRRTMVLSDGTSWPAYRLHENLRQAVNTCDNYTPDGWTSEERRQAAIRAVGHLTESALVEHRGQDTPASRQATASARLPRAVPAFLLAFQAAVEHEILPPDLGQLAYALYELGQWQVLLGLPALPRGTAGELIRLRETARVSADTSLEARERLAQLNALPLQDGDPYAAYAEVVRGNLAFFCGELHEAQRTFTAAVDEAAPLGSEAQLGLIGLALRTSRFTAPLLAVSPALEPRIAQSGSADALGHLELHNARFQRAAEHFSRVLQHARDAKSPLWIARATRHLALTHMWLEPDTAAGFLAEARELNNRLGDTVGLAQCDFADALVHAHRGYWYRAEQLLNRARAGHAAAGVTFDLLPIEAIETLVLLGQDRPSHAWDTAQRLAAAADAGRPLGPPAWTAITRLWTAPDDHAAFDTIDWIEPATARQRWQEPLDTLLAHNRRGE
ncbi:hypothetical protein [Streptomyces sp. CB01373]|uniref:hypothetical protein n=1 Tax=Streptomyces sp. CB01373 TaxID=2020325 RepID=UPI000C2783FA|nr:hypothetical protein [Streptomyces sp. CB01373]PJM91521.1 hypothetical protein CG719_33680 [Streptomyces sp. CB01373]